MNTFPREEKEIVQDYLRVQFLVQHHLEKLIDELACQRLDIAVREGTLAAGLHAFYNQVGLNEGWLKPEYATPLSKQDLTNQRKNVLAALDVVKYWADQFDRIEKVLNRPYSGSLAHAIMGEDEMELRAQECLIEEMNHTVEYLKHERPHQNFGAESQHEQWRKFMFKYQSERIDQQSTKYREDNFRQFHTAYSDLSPKEKNQDKLILAVVTDMILANADIGYERKINVN